MTATPTAVEVHAALAALPGAYTDPHPSRFDSEALALTVTGADPSMVETWVPVHVAAAGHGIDGYVSLTVFVIYAETPDNQGGWMCSSCKVGFPGLSTAVEIAASVQQMAELAAANVNTAARLARDGKLAEALEYTERKRIKWEPVGMNLAELQESLAAAEPRTLHDAVLAEIGPLTAAEDYDIPAIVAELRRLGVTAKHMELLTADVDGQLAIAAENLNVLVWQIAAEHERLAPAS